LTRPTFAAAAAALTVAACSWIAGVSGDVEVIDATDGAADAHDDDAPKPDRAPEDALATDAQDSSDAGLDEGDGAQADE
jgi:hypothetical protein